MAQSERIFISRPRLERRASLAAVTPSPRRTDVVARVLWLQRTLGNRATRQMLRDGRSRLEKSPATRIDRKFTATEDAAGFRDMANAIIAVQNEIRISSSGEVSVHSTNVQGPQTRDAVELLRAIQAIVNDSHDTRIGFIHGSTSTRASDRNVIVGNYALSRIDLDDVAAFGMVSSHSRMGDNAAVQLVHELTEQFRKQVHGEAFPVAHQAGYAAQERLLGATLLRETPMTPIAGTTEGEVTTTYRYPDGREVDVVTRIDFATGQIINVTRNVRPPAGRSPARRP